MRFHAFDKIDIAQQFERGRMIVEDQNAPD